MFLSTQSSIRTGDVSSGNSSLTSHTFIISGDVILWSVAFLLIIQVNELFFPIKQFSSFCIELLSLCNIRAMIIHLFYLHPMKVHRF